MTTTRVRTSAEAHVLSILIIVGPQSDHYIAFLYAFEITAGDHWEPATDDRLIKARESLTAAGLVEDSGERDWKGRTIWAATVTA